MRWIRKLLGLPTAKRYHVFYRCAKCYHWFNAWDLYYSNDVCPYCGNNEGCTITEHIKSTEKY
jgi:rRNA maturation endonuclease Nob1